MASERSGQFPDVWRFPTQLTSGTKTTCFLTIREKSVGAPVHSFPVAWTADVKLTPVAGEHTLIVGASTRQWTPR